MISESTSRPSSKILIAAGLILAFCQGCSNAEFLSGGAAGSGISSATGGSAGGATTQPAGAPPPAAASVPVDTLCSNKRSASAGSNVTEAAELQLLVIDPSSGERICTTTNGIKQSLVAFHVIDFSDCVDSSGISLLTANTYEIEVTDPTSQSEDLLFDSSLDEMPSIEVTRAAQGGAWSFVAANNIGVGLKNKPGNFATYILYALNTNPTVQNSTDDGATGSQCDQSASPLVIDMTADGEFDPGPQLTAPNEGVMFDILGANATVPYAKQKISWVQNANFMFLTLPNAGKVNGIDQLFGNNTKGPDGKFAPNGFLALAKYDLNGDGKIDAADPVFSQLKLWSDRNHDGIAQADELVSLVNLGIESINLVYNAGFFEQDQFGNQIRFKSLANTSQGSRPMFDIWFVLPK